ncbi:MAG TPA: intradiol ring-cleavage dioxygenase [Burkholderiales bacterium]
MVPYRRTLLAAGAALPLHALAQACRITPRQTEGPFFKPSSPERISLVSNAKAASLVVVGRVVDRNCKPVAGALLDFWHADERGEYDNDGFRFRGHQFTDAEGRYRLETSLPGNYGARTRHIHVKVQAAGGPILTTQLYFPGEPQNARDGLFRPELVVRPQKPGVVSFDFVA